MAPFDYVKCKYKLPWARGQDVEWRSTTTPSQYRVTYEVREDGTLWLQCFDLVLSDREPKPMLQVRRTNERWEQQKDFTGGIEIYSHFRRVLFWFRNGQVKDVAFFKYEKEIDAEGQTCTVVPVKGE